ncbi:MAG TPA: hypothetical protein PLY16_02800, partial [Candidatus Saccharibacteria bacterium]|nr:hypothetical protein [Candidatus Saccharibacteria bacterium]
MPNKQFLVRVSFLELYNEEISVDVAISTAKDFLDLYGVELITTAAADDIHGQLGVRPYTQSELDAVDTGRLKRQLVDFIHSLSDLPVELVHYMGLKRVILAHGPIYDNGASTAAGFVDPSDPDLSTVYINPYFPTDGILLHEMFHLWDMKECGPQGTLEDSQYHELNPTPDLYENHDGYRSVESEWDGANGENVVVTRDYGFFNIVEDKATMGASLLTPFQLNRIFNVYDSPILQEKALLLLARINDDRPELAKYLAATHSDWQ